MTNSVKVFPVPVCTRRRRRSGTADMQFPVCELTGKDDKSNLYNQMTPGFSLLSTGMVQALPLADPVSRYHRDEFTKLHIEIRVRCIDKEARYL